MSTLSLIDAGLVGLFAFATIHYAIKWWHARNERVLLLFAVQCAMHAAFCLMTLSRYVATTLPDIQAAHDASVTLGVLIQCVIVHFYARLGERRDRIFRSLVVGVLVVLAVLNQWAPLRGTILELQPMHMPGGGTGLLPIRTEPTAALVVLYVALVAVHGYGVFVACTMWKRDRSGAFLLGIGAVAILVGGVLVAILVDFLHLRAPYIGSLPHAFSVLCMSRFLGREYSARAAREVAISRQFESVFERSPIGKALLAPDGQVLRVNLALSRFLGTTADELCTRRLRDLVRPGDNAADEMESRLLAGELETYSVESRFVRPDREAVWALVVVTVVPDHSGRTTQILVQMQDITEAHTHRELLEELVATRTHQLSDAKEEAERANAAKSQFLAHMSHEIRNPLGVMMAYGQLLQHGASLDASQEEMLGIMLSSGRHVTTILNEVLDLSKIEAGRAELVEDRFDPWSTLDEIERMFAAQCRTKGIGLVVERSAELPRSLHGDVGKVKQILINLVSNAVKFTTEGTITITALANVLPDETTLVTIVVADTGPGIAAQDLERVFLPFEQAKPGARAGGTGLGLAISLSKARLLRGDLTVESTLGVGTTFTLTFQAKRIATPCKVLIVDDLQAHRDVLQTLLTQASFQTRTAAGGQDAISIHADWSPDLVLLDLRMPEMDGIEALRRMRAAGSKATIGMISASTVANDEREAIAVGADFFMRKPYDERELFEQITNGLAARRS